MSATTRPPYIIFLSSVLLIFRDNTTSLPFPFFYPFDLFQSHFNRNQMNSSPFELFLDENPRDPFAVEMDENPRDPFAVEMGIEENGLLSFSQQSNSQGIDIQQGNIVGFEGSFFLQSFSIFELNSSIRRKWIKHKFRAISKILF